MKPNWEKIGVPSKFKTSKPKRNKSVGRPRRRWNDNILIDLKEVYVNIRN